MKSVRWAIVIIGILCLSLVSPAKSYAIYGVNISGSVSFADKTITITGKTSSSDIVIYNGNKVENSFPFKGVGNLKEKSTLIIANPNGQSVKITLAYSEIPDLLVKFLPNTSFLLDTSNKQMSIPGQLARKPLWHLTGHMTNKEANVTTSFTTDKTGSFSNTVKLVEGKNTISSYVNYLPIIKVIKYSLPDFEIELFKAKVIKLVVNSKWMYIDSVKKEVDPGTGATLIIISEWGRTLLPIKSIIESLGGTVSWNGTEKKVTINLSGTKIDLWVNKNYAYVNDKKVQIDSSNSKVTPIIVNSRTMLPIRFVAESIGAYVNWNATDKSILIIYPKE